MLLVIFRTWNSNFPKQNMFVCVHYSFLDFMWNYHYKTFKFDFVGLVTLMAVFILMMQGLGTEDVASVLDWIFSIIFQY
jgi:hypothetical protein